MFINWQLRELNLKVVYYGPALSGKTTNIEQIYAKVNPKRRGELVSLKTQGDRTLYFDFLQIELGKINGLTPKIHLYTVPGQAYYEASRRLVLKGADGVVFVADSAPKRFKANRIAWRDLHVHLKSFDLSIDSLPVIVQFNKRDLDNAVPIPLLNKGLRLNGKCPTFNAIAAEGEGVFDTLKTTIGKVVKRVHQEMKK